MLLYLYAVRIQSPRSPSLLPLRVLLPPISQEAPLCCCKKNPFSTPLWSFPPLPLPLPLLALSRTVQKTLSKETRVPLLPSLLLLLPLLLPIANELLDPMKCLHQTANGKFSQPISHRPHLRHLHLLHLPQPLLHLDKT